jgi:CRISPR-associated endonuclease/helicase Cas3
VRTGKQGKFRDFQEKFGISNKKDYQCIVADTGLGKTGLSVLWSNRKKFYILPNRASVNAMYQTLSDIYGKDNVGLLHSTALNHLLNRTGNNSDISIIEEYEQTRALSKPVTVCTADQLFTAAFNMPGYEKIYATLSYSDIIIDEIQGFRPQQIIPIIKQIKETKELGARYLIITATLPEIVAEKLWGIGFDVITDDKCTIDNIKRHRIKIVDKTIDSLTEDIVSKYRQNKKVLVVVNTVRKAQEIYDKLKTVPNIKAHILHSRFIWRDREKKEEDILEECKQDEDCNYINKQGCIWIATQLVEASLDIDFDCLFTEAATADSLIQRMGRVWRHRKSDYIGEENIIIASDVEYRIYEESLTRQSIEKIYNKLQNGYLTSIDKREIVKEIYSRENLEGSKYLKEWKEFEIQIGTGWRFILEEKAQVAFRDVMTVEMIPAIYEEKIAGLVGELNRINDDSALDRKQRKLRRAEVLKQIQEYKVPVPIYWLTSYAKRHNISVPYKTINRDYNIYILNSCYEYNEEKGLTGKANEVDDFEDRCY